MKKIPTLFERQYENHSDFESRDRAYGYVLTKIDEKAKEAERE